MVLRLPSAVASCDWSDRFRFLKKFADGRIAIAAPGPMGGSRSRTAVPVTFADGRCSDVRWSRDRRRPLELGSRVSLSPRRAELELDPP